MTSGACDFQTLKPHPTDVEIAMERESAQKYCRNNPEIIRQLSDPWECPIEFLPWLAWSLSVDVWNERWPEQTKRAVTANSLSLHAHKGTAGGLEDALFSLGVRPEILEWHEQVPEGERGTMSLTLWVTENINPDSPVMIDSKMVRDLLFAIDSTKRLSVHYTFGIGVEMSASVGIGLSAELASFQRVSAEMDDVRINPGPASVGIGLSAELAILIVIEMTL